MKKLSLLLITAGLVVGCMGTKESDPATSSVDEKKSESQPAGNGLFFWRNSSQTADGKTADIANDTDVAGISKASRRNPQPSQPAISILTENDELPAEISASNVKAVAVTKEEAPIADVVAVKEAPVAVKNVDVKVAAVAQPSAQTPVLARLEALAAARSVGEQEDIKASRHFTEAGKQYFQSFKPRLFIKKTVRPAYIFSTLFL